MSAAIKQIVTVQSGGVVQVRSAELHEGDEAEVTVIVTRSADSEPKVSSPGGWKRFAGGLNTRDAASADNNRIDADLAAEYGSRMKADR